MSFLMNSNSHYKSICTKYKRLYIYIYIYIYKRKQRKGNNSVKRMYKVSTVLWWRGERDIESIKWMGIIRRLRLIRASGGGIWPGTPGLHPPLFTRSAMGIFNDHRDVRTAVLTVSSESRRCLLTVQCPRHYTGVLGPTQTTG